MSEMDVWLVLDGDVIVGDRAYATEAAAQEDVEVLRAAGSQARGCPVPDWEISASRLQVLDAPRSSQPHAADDQAWQRCIAAVAQGGGIVVPFPVPMGDQSSDDADRESAPPAGGLYAAEVDPFALPASLHRLMNRKPVSKDT